MSQETRIIPQEVPRKFYAQHLKPYEFLRNNSAAGKKILEVGCGDGYGCAYLACAADKVVGLDYEKDVVSAAQAKYKAPNLSFVCMDAARLQFEDGAFDVVCSFQVIEHILEDRLPRYLSEIKRVLKTGGKFYLSTLNLEHAMKPHAAYKKNPAHRKEFNARELKDLLSGVFPGFKIYGLNLSLKHCFYQRLKKTGILRFLPAGVNPVSRFYDRITTADFVITADALRKASDFICVCTKGY
ncbi:MAG: class I SAM-dependent methyltransferase [Candidatus Omnitrophota bacterium]